MTVQSGHGAVFGLDPPSRISFPGFLASTDPRHIGAMYLVLAATAGIIGLGISLITHADLVELGMRLSGGAHTFKLLAPGSGLIVASFTLIPALIGGFGSWLVPPMIGARDMAFPRMHNVAFWLLVISFTLFLISLPVAFESLGSAREPSTMPTLIGDGPQLASFYIACASSVLLAINFITTIINMRAARVTLRGMPVLVWSVLSTAILLLLWPPVAASAVMLMSMNAHFGTALREFLGGGTPVDYRRGVSLLVYPEVFVLILPSFGIVSEIVSTFSRRPAFAHRATACGMAALSSIGFFLWAQRVYAGTQATDTYLVLVALVIAVPTAIMIVSWLAAMLRGKVYFGTPMLWAIGFIFLFGVGATIFVARSVVVSSPRDAFSALADFHDVLLLSAVFAIFGGWYYWFPKISGLLYSEAFGKLHFWITFIGVILLFVTQHFANPAGLLRGYIDFQNADASWHESTVVGAYVALVGFVIFLVCMAEALMRRQLANHNPWNAATPEWTSSGAPYFYRS